MRSIRFFFAASAIGLSVGCSGSSGSGRTLILQLTLDQSVGRTAFNELRVVLDIPNGGFPPVTRMQETIGGVRYTFETANIDADADLEFVITSAANPFASNVLNVPIQGSSRTPFSVTVEAMRSGNPIAQGSASRDDEGNPIFFEQGITRRVTITLRCNAGQDCGGTAGGDGGGGGSCGDQRVCDACTRIANCVWCPEPAGCQQWPTPASCNSWRSSPSQCSDPCSNASGCADCVNVAGCGFCNNPGSQRCWAGNANEGFGLFCERNFWIFGSGCP